LSYPAGCGKLPGLAATVCAKLLTSKHRHPHAARSIAFRGGKRFSARRAAKGNER